MLYGGCCGYSFNGWGLTVVESLDTMWLMGLYDEFDAALPVVAQMNFTMAPVRSLPPFLPNLHSASKSS